jgi:hypothetical protein
VLAQKRVFLQIFRFSAHKSLPIYVKPYEVACPTGRPAKDRLPASERLVCKSYAANALLCCMKAFNLHKQILAASPKEQAPKGLSQEKQQIRLFCVYRSVPHIGMAFWHTAMKYSILTIFL